MTSLGLDLSDREFQAFSDLVYEKAGINLHAGKKELVRARLAKRIKEKKFASFGDYYRFAVHDENGDELVYLLDAISTNLTSFFREPKHFGFMAEKFLPELAMVKTKKGPRRLRIWSAGCSTGEEPYSIAMTVLDHLPQAADWDLKILATDISTQVLDTARRGFYTAKRVDELPEATLRRYFQKGRGKAEDWYKIKDKVKSLVVFRRLNLMDPFPFSKSLDLIFCRNVMIYFDKKTQADLITRYSQVLNGGGYLFIGHSESLSGIKHSFQYVQPTIYRKKP
ncbi:MAG: protein-glutamate O-methyltransferase [Thermodesulfobacteriota bacterium]|nr:protein-glutamate O-methyltransferase [Thermodesulfobacteriota bacterium]